jgi:hypothetical protein
MADGRRPWPSAPSKTYTAHGRGCNFCFVIPEWSMVVVRMGTVPVSTGNIAKGDRLCDEFFQSLAIAVKVSLVPAERKTASSAHSTPILRARVDVANVTSLSRSCLLGSVKRCYRSRELTF